MYGLRDNFLEEMKRLKDPLYDIFNKKCGMCGETHGLGTSICPNIRWNYNPIRVI